jgi:hypothetical protein
VALRIDPTKPFEQKIDLTPYVKKVDAGYGCTKCAAVLVQIEVGGILGDALSQLDAAVILDHHLARHP